MNTTYLQATVAPGAELHETRLRIEREVADVNLAVRLEDCRRVPNDGPNHN